MSMEAAQAYIGAITAEVDAIVENTGRLVSVLDRFESRHDDAVRMLLRLVEEAKRMVRTKQRKRAGGADETASTTEQAVSDMIRDILHKRWAEEGQTVCPRPAVCV